MKMRMRLGLLLLAAFWGLAQAQGQVVGRVLLAAGDTVAVRDGREIRLAFNTPIEFKDTLRTGAASSLQVRFVDESLLSLRESSEFQIEEYRFAGAQAAGEERAFFRLIKGGFRSVTGLIGRNQNANYRVRTSTATVGIRGTDYALRDCVGTECGANVKPGVYGTVNGMSGGTNEVTIVNDATPQPAVFGIGTHFHVPDVKTAPQQLLQPPTFVAVKPQGKANATAQGGQGTGGEQASASAGASAESRPQSVTDSSLVITTVGLLPYSVQNTASGGIGFGDVGFLGCGPGSGEGGCGAGLTFLNNLTFATQGGIQVITSFNGLLVDLDKDPGLISGNNAGGSVLNAACFGAPGCSSTSDPSFSAWLGRWNTGSFRDKDGGERPINSGTMSLHYLAVTSLSPFDAITSKSGLAIFSPNAGTQPTNNFGAVGSSSFGAIQVNFGANPTATLTSMSMSFSPFTGFPSGQSYNFSNIPLNIKPGVTGFATIGTSTFVNGACTLGCATSGTSLNIDGAFVGKLARHVGINLETVNNNVVTGQVRVFNCTSGAC
jgi:hypothetical protein